MGADAPAPVPAIPVRPARASQRIPPAVARMVRRRQHERCAVPGCQCRLADLHHLRYRQDGPCEPDEITGLCWAHHRRVHEGLLLIEGTWPALRFRHADGSEYGRPVSAEALVVREQALGALTGMGFKQKEVKEVLVQVCAAGPGAQLSLEDAIRQALALLTPGRRNA